MSVALQAFEDEAEPASRLANSLGLQLDLVRVHEFPDGETLPAVREGADTVLVYRSLDRPNPKLMPLLLACDAWRRAGVRRLVLIAPYLSYLRQDAVFKPGQALSRDVLGALLSPRFDRIVTVDPHLHRTADLSARWNMPVTVLSAAPALAAALPPAENPLVVGPDEEAGPWAAALATSLGGSAITLRKERRGERDVRLTLPEGIAIAGRSVVLVDDVCSSGTTLERAARSFAKGGPVSLDIAVTHALFDAAAAERLQAAGVRRIVSSDSCRHRTNAARLADILAAALKAELAEPAREQGTW
jgi:ribose-phosphate pyrophosphokinase